MITGGLESVFIGNPVDSQDDTFRVSERIASLGNGSALFGFLADLFLGSTFLNFDAILALESVFAIKWRILVIMYVCKMFRLSLSEEMFPIEFEVVRERTVITCKLHAFRNTYAKLQLPSSLISLLEETMATTGASSSAGAAIATAKRAAAMIWENDIQSGIFDYILRI